MRSGASWTQLKENFDFLQQHWPDSISLNMVYNIFCAFDLSNTTRYFIDRGIKKFTLIPIGGHSVLSLPNFPKAIRLLAADQLMLVKQQHTESLCPEDRSLYPIMGLDSIMQSLIDSESKKSITMQEFTNQIKWYDQWSSQKYAELWPDVFDLMQDHLPTNGVVN